jgi:hypothetical protein
MGAAAGRSGIPVSWLKQLNSLGAVEALMGGIYRNDLSF